MTTEDQLARIDALLGEVRALIAENAAQGADPWPTAPLIVASVDGGGPQLLSVLTTHSAATMTSAIVRRSESALTNVVPVTVVPAAALPVLWSALEQWLNGNGDPGPNTKRLIGAVINLREEIVALGVDL